jgi:hypothetical protein
VTDPRTATLFCNDILIRQIDVSPRKLSQFEHERDIRRRKTRIQRYHASSKVLVLSLPTDLHERLHIQLYEHFRTLLIRTGAEDLWSSIGAATRRAGGDVVEGDSTGGPTAQRGGRGDWPTLVIEAGDSVPLQELQATMQLWFAMSDHRVKIVLLAKFSHQRQAIILEKWEGEIPPAPARPGATTTRRMSAALRPVLRQQITITRDATTAPATYKVTGGALVLAFRLLFLQDPGSGQGDIVFSVPYLELYAEHLWHLCD